MRFFRIMRRLEAAEESIAQIRQAMAGTPPQGGGGDGEQAPVFKLDDAKLQEGISNVMGYDPFGKKRSDI